MWMVYVWMCVNISVSNTFDQSVVVLACYASKREEYTVSECYDTCLCVYWQNYIALILIVNNIVSFCLTCFSLLLLQKQLQKVQTKLMLFFIWSGIKWEFEIVCLWFCFSNVFMKVMVSHRHSSPSPFPNTVQISKFLGKSQRSKGDTDSRNFHLERTPRFLK